jgi:hypothetical protein
VSLSVLIDSFARISIQIPAGLTEQEGHMSQRFFVTISTGLAMIAWCAVGAAAQQEEGVKQIEQLIKKSRAEVESINEAK